MKYDLSQDIDRSKAVVKFSAMLNDDKIIELKEVKKGRTIKQNSYLHVLISLFSIEFGYTLEESKTHLKRVCQFMVYEKNGEKFLKQTSKMDTAELTNFIEWIRNYSSQQGLYLPTSEEYLTNQVQIDREIESQKQYL